MGSSPSYPISKLSSRFAEFKAMSGQDKRRRVTDILFNNAMYIIIAAAIIFIAIKVPEFLSVSSIINIVQLTAAKLPIALGIGGAIVPHGYRYFGRTLCRTDSLRGCVPSADDRIFQ